MRNEREGRLGGLRTLFTRQHDVVSAVEDVSFDIEPGELVGYLGPNGAGKSTTIKMLTGIMVPTSGTGEVAGLTPWKERERNALRGHTRRSRPRPVDPDRATSSGVRGGADRYPLMGRGLLFLGRLLPSTFGHLRTAQDVFRLLRGQP